MITTSVNKIIVDDRTLFLVTTCCCDRARRRHAQPDTREIVRGRDPHTSSAPFRLSSAPPARHEDEQLGDDGPRHGSAVRAAPVIVRGEEDPVALRHPGVPARKGAAAPQEESVARVDVASLVRGTHAVHVLALHRSLTAWFHHSLLHHLPLPSSRSVLRPASLVYLLLPPPSSPSFSLIH